MELEKIGKFIAELRKEASLTQEQFGEKLGVTNKTVSRWENGVYLPPADILLAISTDYHVSINDILSGKRLTEDEYKEAAEENLTQTVKTGSFSLKERMEFFKKKWLKEHLAIMTFGAVCILACLISGIALRNPLICGGAVLLFFVAHILRNNAMMAFVEQYAFDGKGTE